MSPLARFLLFLVLLTGSGQAFAVLNCGWAAFDCAASDADAGSFCSSVNNCAVVGGVIQCEPGGIFTAGSCSNANSVCSYANSGLWGESYVKPCTRVCTPPTIGDYPDCHCPPDMQVNPYTYQCEYIPCPEGSTGTPPNCGGGEDTTTGECPFPKVGTPPACTCPDGYIENEIGTCIFLQSCSPTSSGGVQSATSDGSPLCNCQSPNVEKPVTSSNVELPSGNYCYTPDSPLCTEYNSGVMGCPSNIPDPAPISCQLGTEPAVIRTDTAGNDVIQCVPVNSPVPETTLCDGTLSMDAYRIFCEPEAPPAVPGTNCEPPAVWYANCKGEWKCGIDPAGSSGGAAYQDCSNPASSENVMDSPPPDPNGCDNTQIYSSSQSKCVPNCQLSVNATKAECGYVAPQSPVDCTVEPAKSTNPECGCGMPGRPHCENPTGPACRGDVTDYNEGGCEFCSVNKNHPSCPGATQDGSDPNSPTGLSDFEKQQLRDNKGLDSSIKKFNNDNNTRMDKANTSLDKANTSLQSIDKNLSGAPVDYGQFPTRQLDTNFDKSPLDLSASGILQVHLDTFLSKMNLLKDEMAGFFSNVFSVPSASLPCFPPLVFPGGKTYTFCLADYADFFNILANAILALAAIVCFSAIFRGVTGARYYMK